MCIKKILEVLFMDDLKKKKLDRKRIALTQAHERAYLLKIAKEQLKKLEKDKKSGRLGGFVVLLKREGGGFYREKTDKLIRICKALIKCLGRKR